MLLIGSLVLLLTILILFEQYPDFLQILLHHGDMLTFLAEIPHSLKKNNIITIKSQLLHKSEFLKKNYNKHHYEAIKLIHEHK